MVGVQHPKYHLKLLAFTAVQVLFAALSCGFVVASLICQKVLQPAVSARPLHLLTFAFTNFFVADAQRQSQCAM